MAERLARNDLNGIDERLAIGLARDIIRKVGVRNVSCNGETIALKVRSERQRRKSLSILRDDVKNKLIGFKVKKGFFDARIGFFEAFSSRPGAAHDALVVLTSDIDLRLSGRNGPLNSEHWPFVGSPKISALIEVHAIARLIQRGGAETMCDVMDILKRAAAWSDHVTMKSETGSWMLPIDTGMVFIQNQVLPEERGFKAGMSPACMVKTFISHDRLGVRYSDAWRRLAAMGIMDTAPSYPSWEPMSDEHEKMWQAMREEGRRCDLRRERFVQIRSIRSVETIEKDKKPEDHDLCDDFNDRLEL